MGSSCRIWAVQEEGHIVSMAWHFVFSSDRIGTERIVYYGKKWSMNVHIIDFSLWISRLLSKEEISFLFLWDHKKRPISSTPTKIKNSNNLAFNPEVMLRSNPFIFKIFRNNFQPKFVPRSLACWIGMNCTLHYRLHLQRSIALTI